MNPANGPGSFPLPLISDVVETHSPSMVNGPRTYNTDGYRKHKRPDGWASLCPDNLTETPQQLLETGVCVGSRVYNVSGDYALCAQSHRPGHWHGYPIPWSRLPAEAKNALIGAGRLDATHYRKALRKGLGGELAKP